MIFQSLTRSFRIELLGAIHDLSTDTIMIALYGPSASINDGTTAYSALGESIGAGYIAGGQVVTATISQDSYGLVIVDFADVTFPLVSITARGALVYNSSKANRSIMAIDFGLAITRSAADLTIRFPVPDELNAMIRIK